MYHPGDEYRQIDAHDDAGEVEPPVDKFVVWQMCVENPYGNLREDTQQKNLERVVAE